MTKDNKFIISIITWYVSLFTKKFFLELSVMEVSGSGPGCQNGYRSGDV